MNQEIQHLIEDIYARGARKVGVVEVSQMTFEPELRKLCEVNVCGNYGGNWTCPPHIGAVDDLIAKIKGYKTAVVFQTVGELEDSFDFEGMQEAAKMHGKLVRGLFDAVRASDLEEALVLGAGGCTRCKVCAQKTNEPCRFPEEAMASLEAHGIQVSLLAEAANMPYINGKDTVTYFGAVFL